MFCFQCQETVKGTGCTIQGVCGKKAETSRWQDLLLGVVRGVATISDSLRNAGIKTNQEVGDYIVDALFATITNANFDDQAILNKVDNGVRIKRELLQKLLDILQVMTRDKNTWTATCTNIYLCKFWITVCLSVSLVK